MIKQVVKLRLEAPSVKKETSSYIENGCARKAAAIGL